MTVDSHNDQVYDIVDLLKIDKFDRDVWDGLILMNSQVVYPLSQ